MIKITESQLERLVLMLKEQETPSSQPIYYFGNNDSIGITKNSNNDYFVFKMNDDTRGSLGLLPKESELGFIVENSENVKYNETASTALKLAKIINPQNRNEVLYLNNDNIPTIAGIKYVSMNPVISKDLISKGKYSQSKNNEVKGKQFFVSNGKYYTIQLFEPTTAEIA